MQEVLTVLTQVGILVFVVAGMAAMGLSLTVAAIVGPLRDARLLVGVLVANFVVVPVVAVLAANLLPMDDASTAAVILIGTCAGAPFLPTLAGLAKADQATAVGVMVLLMVLTVAFAPVVVPLVLQGATVAAWDIASSLIIYMLVPLALGLVVRARYPDLAVHIVGGFRRASTAGLAIGIVSGLLVTWREVLGSVGSWVFVGTLLVLAVGFGAGWLAGTGRVASDRPLLGLGTAQRNVSAALVIAASIGGDAMVRTLVAALVVPIVLIVVAGEIGKHSQPAATPERPSTPATRPSPEPGTDQGTSS
jgi:predicted Na+-dependent transporter